MYVRLFDKKATRVVFRFFYTEQSVLFDTEKCGERVIDRPRSNLTELSRTRLSSKLNVEKIMGV